jgi:large subunit ribosomal protein L21
MYAIIKSGGKQHRVVPGEVVRLDLMQAEPGDAFETDQVLFFENEQGEARIGTPVVEGAKVQGEVVEHMKDRKVIVFKRKRRKGYRRKNGHRQPYTLVKISAINA